MNTGPDNEDGAEGERKRKRGSGTRNAPRRTPRTKVKSETLLIVVNALDLGGSSWTLVGVERAGVRLEDGDVAMEATILDGYRKATAAELEYALMFFNAYEASEN